MASKRSMLAGLGIVILSASQLTSPNVRLPKVPNVERHNNVSRHNSNLAPRNSLLAREQADMLSRVHPPRDLETDRPPKPIMVIHIGPYKHGTTFLQCTLSGPGFDILLQDNYVYIGTCNCLTPREAKQKRAKCIGHSADSFRGESSRFNPAFRQLLPQLRKQGQNALMVWEYFSDSDVQWTSEFVKLLKGWDVRVVVGYRPAYDFLPSFFSQIQKPYAFRTNYRVWPAEGGDPILPFDMYKMKELGRFNVDSRYLIALRRMKQGTHPTAHAKAMWEHLDQNVTIVDMTRLGPKSRQGGDPLLIHFFCSVMQTPTMCQAAKDNHLSGGATNSRFPANYDLLAVEAYNRGLISRSIKRTVAWEMIRERQENQLNKTSVDFPPYCPSNSSMEELFRLSLSAERVLFPETDEEEHRRGYMNVVQKGKLCCVNTAAVLADPAWVKHISTMSRNCSRKRCKQFKTKDN